MRSEYLIPSGNALRATLRVSRSEMLAPRSSGVGILNPQAVPCWRVHETSREDEDIRCRLPMNDTIAIGDAIKGGHEVQPVQHGQRIFAGRGNGRFDACLPSLCCRYYQREARSDPPVCALLRGRLRISQVCWWADVSRLAWVASQPACRSQRLYWQRERLGFVFQGQADQLDRLVQRDHTRIDDEIVEHRIVRVLVIHRLKVA